MDLVLWLPFFVLKAVFEGTGHIFLKKGSNRHSEVTGIRFYLLLLKDKFVLLAFAINVFEIILWVLVLAYLPLSVAFPLTGMNEIFVIFASAYFLKEHINIQEWIGIASISIGLLIIILYG
ncbi:MAG: EamA family transporter [Spirochaetes bacterium]|nr:EamA family transporter [Spirochaetota bacterium]